MPGKPVVPPASLFVGRDEELARLAGLAHRAREGEAAAALIAGEAGIGKSALLTAFVEQLPPETQVVWGRCRETAGAPAYWPWAQVLLECPSLAEPPTEPVARGLARLSEVAPGIVSPPVAPAPETSDRVARFELSLATAAILEGAAADAPLVVVFDDLHATDEASVALLTFVVDHVRHHPVLFVAAYREHELSDSARSHLTRLPGETNRLSLGGLDDDRIAAIATGVIGSTPSEGQITSVTQLAQGNPLFAREVARLLASTNAAPGTHTGIGPLPLEIREVMQARLATLPREIHDLLEVGAVIGREFAVDFLAEVARVPTDRALGMLEYAARSGVAEGIPAPIPHYRFHHVLAQAVLYDSLGAERRVELHRRAADVIERRFAEDLDPHLSELAHHLGAAAVGGDAERAIEALRAAGERASRLLAFGDASGSFERAVALVEANGEAGSRRHAELLLALGRVGQRAGLDGARNVLRRCADVARARGWVDLFSEAALAMPVSLGTTGGRPAVDRESVAHLEEALTMLPAGDSLTRALVLAELTDQRYWADPFERASDLSGEAVAIARRLGDPATLGRALAAHHYAIWGPDTTDERAKMSDEILAIAERIRDPELEFMGMSARIPQLVERADGLAVDQEISRAEQLFDRVGHGVARWALLRWKAMRALMRGDLEDAEAWINDAVAVDVPDPAASLEYWGIQSFILAFERGTLGELEPVFRPAVDAYPDIIGYRAALAFILIEAGKLHEARSEFDFVVAHGLDDIRRDLGWATTIGLLCRCAAVLGDEDVNRRLHVMIAPYADRCVVVADGTLFGGSNAHWAALTAWRGDLPGAGALFDQAEAAYRNIGARPFLAHALVDHATFLMEASAGDEARPRLDEALEIYRRCGMGHHEARASSLQEAQGTAEVRDTARHVASLRREGEVWEVAFDDVSTRLAAVKGLGYLAMLVATPGREHHALDLVGSPGADHGAGEVLLDERARREYAERLRDLQEEADEARSFEDPERVAKAEAEIDAIAAELSGAVGLGGRSRRAPSPTERARTSVTKAIRGAIRRIDDHVPALAAHLERSVRTGTYCSYMPDPSSNVDWEV
ncbi:MAG: AAA family ATPase [Actinobacteria bacterium]|nr:AAA family ATPase [Actinomycetota bacterium]